MVESDLIREKLPFVSIVVLNYNGKAFLGDCLNSLFNIRYPSSLYEVLVVDNASTDGSVEYIRNQFTKVKLFALEDNYGFAEGNNIGANYASGDFVAFLNNDTVVTEYWLNELVKIALLDKKIAICGSKIKSINDKNITQYNGYTLHILGGVIPGKPHVYTNQLGNQFNIIGSVQGSSFLVRKNIFNKIGCFDRDYFLYSDEVDLCYRAWITGYHVAYCPTSIVYHYSGGTAGNFHVNKSGFFYNRLNSSMRIYYGNRNSLINVVKNLELQNIFLGVLFSFSIFIFQLIFLLYKHDSKNTKLLFISYLWPIKNFKVILKKRFQVQVNRKVSDKDLISKGLLLSIDGLIKIAQIKLFRVKQD